MGYNILCVSPNNVRGASAFCAFEDVQDLKCLQSQRKKKEGPEFGDLASTLPRLIKTVQKTNPDRAELEFMQEAGKFAEYSMLFLGLTQD